MKKILFLMALIPTVALPQSYGFFQHVDTRTGCLGAGCAGVCTHTRLQVTPELEVCSVSGSIMTFSSTEGYVFNEIGSNVDFRVEGDTDSNLLFLDASADRVGIGTNAPENELHVHRASSGANLRIEGTGAGIFLESTAGVADERLIQTFVSSGGLYRIRGLNDSASESVSGITLDLGTGAVGINTTMPASSVALDVKGNLTTRDATEELLEVDSSDITYKGDSLIISERFDSGLIAPSPWTAGTLHTLSWGEIEDTDTMIATTGTTATINTAGSYMVSAYVTISENGFGCQGQILLNTTSIISQCSVEVSEANYPTACSMTVMKTLAVSDTLIVKWQCDQTGQDNKTALRGIFSAIRVQ